MWIWIFSFAFLLVHDDFNVMHFFFVYFCRLTFFVSTISHLVFCLLKIVRSFVVCDCVCRVSLTVFVLNIRPFYFYLDAVVRAMPYFICARYKYTVVRSLALFQSHSINLSRAFSTKTKQTTAAVAATTTTEIVKMSIECVTQLNVFLWDKICN